MGKAKSTTKGKREGKGVWSKIKTAAKVVAAAAGVAALGAAGYYAHKHGKKIKEQLEPANIAKKAAQAAVHLATDTAPRAAVGSAHYVGNEVVHPFAQSAANSIGDVTGFHKRQQEQIAKNYARQAAEDENVKYGSHLPYSGGQHYEPAPSRENAKGKRKAGYDLIRSATTPELAQLGQAAVMLGHLEDPNTYGYGVKKRKTKGGTAINPWYFSKDNPYYEEALTPEERARRHQAKEGVKPIIHLVKGKGLKEELEHMRMEEMKKNPGINPAGNSQLQEYLKKPPIDPGYKTTPIFSGLDNHHKATGWLHKIIKGKAVAKTIMQHCPKSYGGKMTRKRLEHLVMCKRCLGGKGAHLQGWVAHALQLPAAAK